MVRKKDTLVPDGEGSGVTSTPVLLTPQIGLPAAQVSDQFLDELDMQGLAERLEAVVADSKIRHFASRSRTVSEALLRKYLKGSMPGFDKAAEIAAVAGVSLDWLATGKPPFIHPRWNPQTLSASAHKQFDGEDGGSTIMVPRYDIEAAAGSGREVLDEIEVERVPFPEQWLRAVVGGQPSKLALINAVGDSMEPEINEGDLLFVDRSITSVPADGIYVLNIEGRLFVKRLQQHPDGRVTVRNSNPQYENYVIEKDAGVSLRIIGRVRWHGRPL